MRFTYHLLIHRYRLADYNFPVDEIDGKKAVYASTCYGGHPWRIRRHDAGFREGDYKPGQDQLILIGDYIDSAG